MVFVWLLVMIAVAAASLWLLFRDPKPTSEPLSSFMLWYLRRERLMELGFTREEAEDLLDGWDFHDPVDPNRDLGDNGHIN